MKSTATGSTLLLLLAMASCAPKVMPPERYIPPFEVVSQQDTLLIGYSGGVYYMLPKTRLDITVQVRKTERVKGPYANFAGKYLGIDNVINTNVTHWQIEAIEIKPIAVPDPDHLCFVAFGAVDGSSIPDLLQLNLNHLGMLNGSVPGNDNHLIEHTSIISSGIGYSSVFKYFAEDNLFETIDTVVERISVDTMTIEQTVYRKKMVEKPMEQRAKEAADFIQKLKDQRINLLTGYQEIPYDPLTIRYMAEELEKMERDYIELFTGITNVTTHKKVYSHVPSRNEDCIPVVLARFSSQDGLLPAESTKGEMLSVQVCSQGVIKAKHRLPSVNPDTTLNDCWTGVIYRIPEYTLATVYLGSRMQKEVGLPMPQFGSTGRLPAFITKFVLDPETGAIRQLQHN